ncbi:MAG: VCBS repeat-containing protein [Myxacorys chilensis ATA2-1-KO14]|jgi:hypothetical protein|nr:VCBS repeat-containing protein [Myxacorys chilensis ATA2-1-KO14]
MPTTEQFNAAKSLDNPFSLQIEEGTLSSNTNSQLYKVSASSSSLNARLALTDLTGNALLKVYGSDRALIKESNQPSRLSESILLDSISSGTYYIEVALDPAAVTSANYKLNVEFNTTADFNNIVWHNAAAQQAAIWQMSGSTLTGFSTINGVGPEWQTQGFADFDGDGEDDIVWRNLNSGQLAFWFLKDKQLVSAVLGNTVSLDWKVVGTANLDGNNFADLVWQRYEGGVSTGTVALWQMQGATIANSGVLESARGWSIEKIGDFDGDNQDDLYWRSTDGGTAVFLLSGITKLEGALGPSIPLEWKLQFVSDLNADGRDDLIWRNERTGTFGLWLMDGLQFSDTRSIESGLGWRIEQVADFNKDGKADLFCRSVNNDVAVALMDGLTTTQFVSLPSVGQEWKVEQVADFNGDGKADLLWRSESLQSAAIWLIDGTATTVSLLKDSNGADLSKAYNGIDASWKIRGTLERNLTSQPFSISGATLETAFNIGILDDAGRYQDKIGQGENDFYKFSVGIESDLTASVSSGAALELYKNVDGAWTKQAYQAGIMQTIGKGDYYIQIGGATQPTTYTLDILGVPRRIDLSGTAFVGETASFALVESTDPAINKVNATFQIKNLETFVASDFTVSFYISRDSVIDPFDPVPNRGDRQLEISLNGDQEAIISGKDLLVKKGLGKNGTFDGNVTLTLPGTQDVFWTIDKSYFIGMAINLIGYQNETNAMDNFNVALGKDKLELKVTNVPTIDLSGQSLTKVTPGSSFQPGAKINLQYAVANLGSRPTSSEFKVKFYASLDPDINPEQDREIGADIVTESILKQSVSGTRSIEVMLPDRNSPELQGKSGNIPIYIGMYVNADVIDISDADPSNNVNQGVADPAKPRFDVFQTSIDV